MARAPVLLALLLAALLALAGCDGSTSTGAKRISRGRLSVYASLPFTGPDRGAARAVLEGAEMALAARHGRVGRYTIILRSLNDATVAKDGWDPGQTTANARLAAHDQRSIGYLGDLNSGATAVSIPVLNRAKLPQVSPTATAVGLTEGGPEAEPGEPEKYYPTMTRTFARVVPNDVVQSAVQVALQRQAGCHSVYLLYDDQDDGRDPADSYEVAARRAGLHVLGSTQFAPTAKAYTSLAKKLAGLDPDCLLVSALPSDHAAAVTDAVARALPDLEVFATAPLAVPAFVDTARGGLAASVASRVTITAPALALGQYPPSAQRVAVQFRRRYGAWQPGALFGYASMALLLHAVARASADGTEPVTRAAILRALFDTRDCHSVLGTYSLDAAGDTSLRRYGVYRVSGGRLVYWKAMRAPGVRAGR